MEPERQTVIDLGERLLEMNPDAIPRYLILRDILCLPSNAPPLIEAKQAMLKHPFIERIRSEQREDGGWGNFHTPNYHPKRNPSHTQAAVRRAVNLGLDATSDILRNLTVFILQHFAGKADWPDYKEKQDNPAYWDYGSVRSSAACLALYDRDHPALVPFREEAVEKLHAAYADGMYNRERELEHVFLLSGIRSRCHVPVHHRLSLLVLSSAGPLLDAELESKIMLHALQHIKGFGYLQKFGDNTYPSIENRNFARWLGP